ncbi:methyltransferase family protein [Novosphingopyxis sp. YJ-S2-01]|uniref:methyltransferase family protein n=1 Tax=Novosphingopyxis sp. YJ-S2-01 TaxID=2794021 RepID=UPI0018DEC5BB|nr:isoprenylcysteine carboxylmethyltransferase family protein [Novosphingopyxis sp. YJ-S2-01]MBH9537086.1 DUF1295 domain-containing protein [Novosphingopyxis sp. YJ-S2-01]
MSDRASSVRPASAVGIGVGLSGLAGLAIWVMIARNFGALADILGFPGLPERASGPNAALLGIIACGAPMILWSLLIEKVHRRPSTGIDWSLKRPLADVVDISIVKITGFWATWGLIAAVYAVGRFWWETRFADYPFSMHLFEMALVPLIVLSVPYVVWLGRHLIEPKDGAWHFGAWIAGRGGWDREMIHHHLRAWAVKGFFLAFMLAIVPPGFSTVVNFDLSEIARNPVWIASALITTMFLVDVQLATVGYLLTMRPLDSHIRTANPYLAGWVAALICYPPFTLMNGGGPLDYQVGTASWSSWFAGYPALLAIWGAVLVVLTGVYAYATVAFGLRFSNLTHRGILTHGPYKWTRHPAYLAKNAYWWAATLPFIVTSGSLADALRNSALMALVSAVYYWRARTEEKHLLADPVYQTYYDWSEENAVWRRFLRKFSGGRLGQRTRPTPEIVPAE